MEVNMDIERKLLDNFKKIYEKQERLSSLTDEDLFDSLSNSEIHTIDIIGSSKDVNGVLIASRLEMTRGAISKIIGKLSRKGVVDSYQLKENKKEIYYKLTDYGQSLYRQHELAHRNWEDRELEFFNSLAGEEKNTVNDFLIKYNDYLSNLINERS